MPQTIQNPAQQNLTNNFGQDVNNNAQNNTQKAGSQARSVMTKEQIIAYNQKIISDIEAKAQLLKPEFRDLYMYVEFSRAMNKPLDPEIAKLVEELEGMTDADFKNLQKLQNLNTKIQYGKTLRLGDIDSLINN